MCDQNQSVIYSYTYCIILESFFRESTIKQHPELNINFNTTACMHCLTPSSLQVPFLSRGDPIRMTIVHVSCVSFYFIIWALPIPPSSCSSPLRRYLCTSHTEVLGVSQTPPALHAWGYSRLCLGHPVLSFPFTWNPPNPAPAWPPLQTVSWVSCPSSVLPLTPQSTWHTHF